MIFIGEKPQLAVIVANILCLFDTTSALSWINGGVAVTGAIILLINNVHSIYTKVKKLQKQIEQEKKDDEKE